MSSQELLSEEVSLSKTATETEWKGLHPLSLLINLLPQMWQTIRNTWPILVFIFVGGEGTGTQFIDIFFVLIFSPIYGANAITLSHTTISPHKGQLEVKMGLLFAC